MDQKPNADENLRQEFETLGRNLVDALRSAWESPETRRVRDDVINGLSDLGATLRREADNLASSDAAQQVRSGVGQAADKVRAPEVQAKMRSEILGALKTVNGELQRMIERMSEPDAGPAAQAAPEAPVSDAPAGSEPSISIPVPEDPTKPKSEVS